jgi:hypothetical protein
MNKKIEMIEEEYRIKIKDIIITIRKKADSLCDSGKKLKKKALVENQDKLTTKGFSEYDKINEKIENIMKDIDDLLTILEKKVYSCK